MTSYEYNILLFRMFLISQKFHIVKYSELRVMVCCSLFIHAVVLYAYFKEFPSKKILKSKL